MALASRCRSKVKMAAPTKKFHVRSANAIQLADDEALKQRQERLRRHFEDSAPTPVTSDSIRSAACQKVPPETSGSTLSENSDSIKKSAAHTAALDELRSVDLPNQKPVPPKEQVNNVASCDQPVLGCPTPSTSNALLISFRQKGNPVIKFLRNIRYEYADIIPDYILGRTTCALFLSVRYHALHPDYIHERLKQLGKSYELRVLLVQVDTKDPHHSLKQLTKIAILSDCTLMLSWSPEDAAKILETYKIFENKPPEILMKKQESDSFSKVIDALSSIRTINKSDAMSLMTTFQTFENISNASTEDLEVCPGMGPKKAYNLLSALHKPFLK